MRVSIFGLGYVGTVCAACLARFGHDVVGVDVNEDKNAQISAGRSPIVEPGLEELIREAVDAGRLEATGDHARAIATTELSLICVGTPSRRNGSLDTSHVEEVAREIGRALKGRDEPHTVVVRSTLLPGTTLSLVRPALEQESERSCARARLSPTSTTRRTRSSAGSTSRAPARRPSSTPTSTLRCTWSRSRRR